MKKGLLLLLFTTLSITGWSQKSEIKPYINYLKGQNIDPVDYVFGLFDKYDIVILGERDHRDTTQYELINKIISDHRFIKKIGNVFTEVGVNNRTEWANKILKGKYKTYAEFEDSLRKLYREMDYEVLWENYNYWMLLSTIYKVNSVLPQSKKISYYPTDIVYDWSQCTSQQERDEFYTLLNNSEYPYNRDSIMGDHFIKEYELILKNKKEPRKKALLIQSTYHSSKAYQYTTRGGDTYLLETPASVIFDKYKGKVANVLLNNMLGWKEYPSFLPVQGKWDAAFRFLGNPALGFDLSGTPFGEDLYDRYERPTIDTRYKDVYTGYIYYKQVEQFVLSIGIPGIVDEDFKREFSRRINLIKFNGTEKREWTNEEIESWARHYSIVRSFPIYYDKGSKEKVEGTINQWFE